MGNLLFSFLPLHPSGPSARISPSSQISSPELPECRSIKKNCGLGATSGEPHDFSKITFYSGILIEARRGLRFRLMDHRCRGGCLNGQPSRRPLGLIVTLMPVMDHRRGGSPRTKTLPPASAFDRNTGPPDATDSPPAGIWGHRRRGGAVRATGQPSRRSPLAQHTGAMGGGRLASTDSPPVDLWV